MSAPSLTALIGGEVSLTLANIPAIYQHVKSGRLRPLASAGPKRSELMPEVPTMADAGVKGVEVVVWYGILAPAPPEIVKTLAASIRKAALAPDVKQKLVDQGADPLGSAPEAFATVLREEVAKWAEVVRASGAKAD